MDGGRPNRDELVRLAREQPEVIADLVLALWDRVEALEAKVAELTRNSRNSSKPPSSDKGNPNKPSKPSADKKKKKRRPGGQPGHRGHTREMVSDPDFVVPHGLDPHCAHCGCDLGEVKRDGVERRQVVDLPPMRIEVTEHQVDCAKCPHCKKTVKGEFPDDVSAPVQYGSGIQALVTYLGTYQMLPCERTSEFFRDLLDCDISTGTVINILNRAGKKADPVAEGIRLKIRDGALMGNDETGASLGGKNHWLHIACTDRLSYYYFHPKRGFDALEEIGILPGYTGYVIHDYFQSYYKYESCKHSLCNAHHLRDLTYISEEMKQEWANEMIGLLLEAKMLRKRDSEGGRKIGTQTIARILSEYRVILAQGYKINPEPPKIEGKRGRPKRGKALCMLDRFRDRKNEVLGFFIHGEVPFDNNQSERDLRMIKAKLKISGCFRSPQAAEAFAKVRSVVSTAKKAGSQILGTLKQLFENPEKLKEVLLS